MLAKTGMGLGASVDITGTKGSGIDVSNLLCHVGFSEWLLMLWCPKALCFLPFLLWEWSLGLTSDI